MIRLKKEMNGIPKDEYWENQQGNLTNKAKGEHPMSKVGKPNGIVPMQEAQKIMKMVSVADFQIF